LGSPALVAQQENVYNKKILQIPSLRWMAARYYNFPKIEKKRQGRYIGNYKKKIVIIIIIRKRYWVVPHSSPNKKMFIIRKMLQTPSLRWMAARYYNFPKIEKKRQGIYIGNCKKKI